MTNSDSGKLLAVTLQLHRGVQCTW